jgi:hypothetical protein
MLAANYARTWALSRNPEYADYSGQGAGGDCTNFVSQAMYAGGWGMLWPSGALYYSDLRRLTDPSRQWWTHGSNKPGLSKYFVDASVEFGLAGLQRLEWASSSTWAAVADFARFLQVSGRASRCARAELELADIVMVLVQGDPKHALVVTAVHPALHNGVAYNDIFISSHTKDYVNKPLAQVEKVYNEFAYWKVADIYDE